jgi:hypothetical protein
MKRATQHLLAGYSEVKCIVGAACGTIRMLYPVSPPHLQESYVIKDWMTLLDAFV